MKMNKKGILGQLGDIFQQLAFIGIFGAIVLIMLANLNSSVSDTTAKSAIQNTTLSIANTFGQFPLFGTILGLMLIVGLVFVLFRGGKVGGGGLV
jgi:asparagine N-glycosylation enzyme membrane subunit Stt3